MDWEKSESGPTELTVPAEWAGKRIDLALGKLLGCSREKARRLIDGGQVTLAGALLKPSVRLRGGEALVVEPVLKSVEAELVPAQEERLQGSPLLLPASLPIAILYEDEDLLVVDKPRGLVVHPGAGRPEGTLVQLLQGHVKLPAHSEAGRPGIVHRLDKDTTGLMVLAKNEAALEDLTRQFARRTVRKTYQALVHGRVEEDEGRIEVPLRIDHEEQKVVVQASGKEASTDFRVLERFSGFTLLELHPQTGRTHQLRVHLAFISHPVVGDPLYGLPNPWKQEGQLLHAGILEIQHPRDGRRLQFRAPLPRDFQNILDQLLAGSSSV